MLPDQAIKGHKASKVRHFTSALIHRRPVLACITDIDPNVNTTPIHRLTCPFKPEQNRENRANISNRRLTWRERDARSKTLSTLSN